MAYNIKHGRGMDGVVDLQRIAAVIRAQSPDIVALQEVDFGCRRSGEVDQPRVLGELCGMHYVFGEIRPYDGGRYGMAMLSRHAILDATVVAVQADSWPRFALEVGIALPGDGARLVVTGVHLYRTEAERLAQARVLVTRRTNDLGPLIAGDFNSERGSNVMRQFEDGWANPPKDEPAGTFPSPAPVKEIDFVLVPVDPRIEVLRSSVVPESIASDHRAIVLDLLVTR